MSFCRKLSSLLRCDEPLGLSTPPPVFPFMMAEFGRKKVPRNLFGDSSSPILKTFNCTAINLTNCRKTEAQFRPNIVKLSVCPTSKCHLSQIYFRFKIISIFFNSQLLNEKLCMLLMLLQSARQTVLQNMTKFLTMRNLTN